MATVQYKYGLKEKFLALPQKDENTLYWLIDTQELYKGDLLFAVGKEASTTASGLLSKEDKAKLDAFSEGALRFRGVYNSLDEVTNPVSGDLVIIGTKEYVYDANNAQWVELGDEGLYLTQAEAEATYLKKEEAETLYVSSNAIIEIEKKIESNAQAIENTSKAISWAPIG